MRKRSAAILLFGETLLDVPFLLAALLPALTPWRMLPLWRALRLWERNGVDASERRKAAWCQLCEALKDWAHLLPAFMVLCTCWRARGMWVALRLGGSMSATEGGCRVYPTAAERRQAVRIEYYETMLDYAHLPMGGAVLLLCPWRAMYLWSEAKPWPGASRTWHLEYYTPDATAAAVAAPRRHHVQAPSATPAAAAAIPAAGSRAEKIIIKAAERRAAARHHLLGFVVDLPIILMATIVLATAWRAPLLWRSLKLGQCKQSAGKQRTTAEERWAACLDQFLRLVRDVPFLVLAPVTSYRFPRVVLKVSKCLT